MLALVGIVDPPRPQAKAAIAKAKAAGIQVRMITGDHAVTAAGHRRPARHRGPGHHRRRVRRHVGRRADRRPIDGVGVIARVTPEHKVRLVEMLQRKGHIVAMTGDGVNDAPALKKADIGIAMGITGTEVSKEAAAMILTDDDFATIVKRGRARPRPLRQPAKYIFFQMGALIGFIVTFLGASIFNIAAGVPFLPLQTLWVNFTTQVFQADRPRLRQAGAGHHAAQAAPAPTSRCCPATGSAGSASSASSSGVGDPRRHRLGRACARHGRRPDHGPDDVLAVQPLLVVHRPDDLRSVFSLDTFDDRRFVLTSGMSVAAIVLATEFGLFQRMLQSVELDLGQWLVCIAVGSVDHLVYGDLQAVRPPSGRFRRPGPPLDRHGTGTARGRSSSRGVRPRRLSSPDGRNGRARLPRQPSRSGTRPIRRRRRERRGWAGWLGDREGSSAGVVRAGRARGPGGRPRCAARPPACAGSPGRGS